MPLIYACDNHPNRQTDIESVSVTISRFNPSALNVIPQGSEMMQGYLCAPCRVKLATKLAALFSDT